jgi:hypothetical protein
MFFFLRKFILKPFLRRDGKMMVVMKNSFIVVGLVLLGITGCERQANVPVPVAPPQQAGGRLAVPPSVEADGFVGESEVPVLVISEFLAANDQGLKDDDGDRLDWIEIFNPGREPVDLSNFGLTQDRQLATVWPLPGVLLGAGEYQVIFASGKDRREAGGELHADFKLSKDGEFLALMSIEPRQVVHSYGTTYPSQQSDVSYGIASDWKPGEFLEDYESFFLNPTPGSTNGEILFGFVEDVKISHEHGFMDAPFELTFATPTAGALIRYTVDGSKPTSEHGIVYGAPIHVEHTSVFRVAAFKDGHHPSDIETRTFLFLSDVLKQSPDEFPSVGFSSEREGNVVDYGMDPEVVGNPAHAARLLKGLHDLPAISIVMDIRDLFGEENGIHRHAGEDGRKWERSCSTEYVLVGGKEGFQVDCGIRIQGGFSRAGVNPKHSFRLFFRDAYGPSKLSYPLFGESGAKKFDIIDLRASLNDVWSVGNDGDHRLFIRDLFNRDLQRAMGHLSPNGDFCHLFINGIYWGLYNICERPEAAFASSYLPGGKGDFDVIKINNGETEEPTIAVDGNTDAWKELWNSVKDGVTSNEAYFKLQGKRQDGSNDPDGTVLLDVDNLIDYMLVIIWSGNKDAQLSDIMGEIGANNWYGFRNRNGREGFRFILGDAERIMIREDLENDRTGPFSAGQDYPNLHPQHIWQQCQENPEFRLRVADRIHRHFFNQGVLTVGRLIELFDTRTKQIEDAVIAESARWGDSDGPGFGGGGDNPGMPLGRDEHWRKVVEYTREEYLPKRSDIVLAQLFAHGLYPDLEPPSASRSGGGAAAQWVVSAPAGDVFYTLNGSDPRQVGGDRSADALEYSGPIKADDSIHTIKARSYLNGEWSALLELELLSAPANL